MRWDEELDKRGLVGLSAFSAVTAGEGDLGFEWRVTQRRGKWAVADSAAELLSGDAAAMRFESAGAAVAWCEAEESRIVTEYRERSTA